MNRAEFIKQAQEERLLQSYLFLGEEKLFSEELLKLAVEKLLAPEDREFNFLKFNAGGILPEDLAANCEALPFFSAIRVIYLEDFEKASANLEEAVMQGVTRLAGGVYFFISAAKLDGRKKNHQELQKRINTVDCGRLRSQDIPLWIKQRAEKMGLKLTAGQVSMLGERLGPDLLRIRTELEKIRTFAGSGSVIGDSDLQVLIPGDPEADIFGLIDAVAQRNSRLGLPKLEDLLNSGENELKILATLSKQFRNITAALAARDEGASSKILADELGIKPFVADKSFTQSYQFSFPELQKILERLLQADYRIKTGQQEPRLELELTVTEICNPARR